MRRNIRQKEMAEGFAEKHAQAKANRQLQLGNLIDRIYFVEGELQSLVDSYRLALTEKKRKSSDPACSIEWSWRPHKNLKKLMPIEVYLIERSVEAGKPVRKKRSLRKGEQRQANLERHYSSRQSRKILKWIDQILSLSETVTRWVSELCPGEAEVLNKKGWGYGLDAWIEQIAPSCEQVSLRLAGMVEEFLQIDDELDDLVFEFNGDAQPVRFHSIICRRESLASDPLSPSEPRFRVVTSLNRGTGRRNSKDLQAYKVDLALKRLREQLEKNLGREPTGDEVKAAKAAQRNRRPSPYITAEVIENCWLGKHSATLLSHQKKMVAVMDPWKTLRSTIQSLLT